MTNTSTMLAESTDKMQRLFQAVNARSKKVVRESGLTGPQPWTIRMIPDIGPVRISEFARRLYLHPVTVGRMLERLEVNEGIESDKSSELARRLHLHPATVDGMLGRLE
jgi:Mn-dependent DtxR family transcriptional regulator